MVQEAQRETEIRGIDFRSILEGIPAITYVEPFADPEPGALLYVSPQSEAILGYQEEWLEVPGLWRSLLHPDDRDALLEASRRAHRSGEPWNRDYRLIARDGRVVWVRDHATLVRDEQGRPLYWRGVMLDVTAERLTEEALRESEARYRAVVEQIPAITYTQTMTTPPRTLYISPQVETLLGYSPDLWQRTPSIWTSRLHPDDRDRVLTEDGRTRTTGDPFSMEYRLVAADGHIVWFRDEARVVRDRDGNPLFWQGVMLDVTHAKTAEEALRESEARYRALVENIPAVVYVARPDDDSTTLYVSPQIERILGYSQAEWLEQPDIWMELLHDDDREEVLAAHDRHNQTGEPWRAEYRLISAGGRVVWFRDEATLVLDGEARPRFWQGVRMDITDRKRAEEALERARAELELRVVERTEQLSEANELMMLEVEERRRAERQHREAEERLRTLIEQLPAVVYVWRPSSHLGRDRRPASPGTYTSAEIERLLGYTAEEWQSSANFWLEHTHPDDRDRVWDASVRTEQTGEPFEIEYRYIAKDGRIVWVHDRATPMGHDEQGQPTFFQGVIVDITQQKLAEERVRSAEARYRALVEEMPAVVYLCKVDPERTRAEASYTSPQIEELLGFTPEEWNADPESSIRRLHPDDRERVLARATHCKTTGEPFDMEYRFLHKNGDVVWVHDRALLVEHDARGRPGFIQGVLIDISRRKRAESQLRQAEELYRTLVEQIPAVTFIEPTSTRPGRPRISYMSPQIEKVLGYPLEQIIQDPDLWIRLIHPGDRERWIAADVRARESGEPFDVEYRLFAADGRVVWVWSHAVLVRDDEGRPRFWQGVMFDITERKRAEAELRELNAQLASRASAREEQLHETEEMVRDLIAEGPGVIFRGAANGRSVTYVSPNVEQVLGYRPEEMLAEGWIGLLHPDDRERLESQIAQALDRRQTLVESDARVRHSDGSYRTFHYTVRYRYDEAGEPTSFLGVSIDVTHRAAEAAAAGGVGFEPTSESPR